MHCVKSVQIRSISGSNTRKYGPEITPYLDTFHEVMLIWLILIQIRGFFNYWRRFPQILDMSPVPTRYMYPNGMYRNDINSSIIVTEYIDCFFDLVLSSN